MSYYQINTSNPNGVPPIEGPASTNQLLQMNNQIDQQRRQMALMSNQQLQAQQVMNNDQFRQYAVDQIHNNLTQGSSLNGNGMSTQSYMGTRLSTRDRVSDTSAFNNSYSPVQLNIPEPSTQPSTQVATQTVPEQQSQVATQGVEGQQNTANTGANTDLLMSREGEHKNEQGQWVVNVEKDASGKTITWPDGTPKLVTGNGHVLSLEEAKQYPQGSVVPNDVIQGFTKQDTELATGSAKTQIQELGMPESMMPVMTSMNYQLGSNWPEKFPKAYELMKNGHYAEAAVELGKDSSGEGPSKWATQTPKRYQDAVTALNNLENGVGDMGYNADGEVPKADLPMKGVLASANASTGNEGLDRSAITQLPPNGEVFKGELSNRPLEIKPGTQMDSRYGKFEADAGLYGNRVGRDEYGIEVPKEGATQEELKAYQAKRYEQISKGAKPLPAPTGFRYEGEGVGSKLVRGDQLQENVDPNSLQGDLKKGTLTAMRADKQITPNTYFPVGEETLTQQAGIEQNPNQTDPASAPADGGTPAEGQSSDSTITPEEFTTPSQSLNPLQYNIAVNQAAKPENAGFWSKMFDGILKDNQLKKAIVMGGLTGVIAGLGGASASSALGFGLAGAVAQYKQDPNKLTAMKMFDEVGKYMRPQDAAAFTEALGKGDYGTMRQILATGMNEYQLLDKGYTNIQRDANGGILKASKGGTVDPYKERERALQESKYLDERKTNLKQVITDTGKAMKTVSMGEALLAIPDGKLIPLTKGLFKGTVGQIIPDALNDVFRRSGIISEKQSLTNAMMKQVSTDLKMAIIAHYGSNPTEYEGKSTDEVISELTGGDESVVRQVLADVVAEQGQKLLMEGYEKTEDGWSSSGLRKRASELGIPEAAVSNYNWAYR